MKMVKSIVVVLAAIALILLLSYWVMIRPKLEVRNRPEYGHQTIAVNRAQQVKNDPGSIKFVSITWIGGLKWVDQGKELGKNRKCSIVLLPGRDDVEISKILHEIGTLRVDKHEVSTPKPSDKIMIGRKDGSLTELHAGFSNEPRYRLSPSLRSKTLGKVAIAIVKNNQE